MTALPKRPLPRHKVNKKMRRCYICGVELSSRCWSARTIKKSVCKSCLKRATGFKTGKEYQKALEELLKKCD
jgi:hypothetical protein